MATRFKRPAVANHVAATETDDVDSNEADRFNMERMGKSQQLKRDFGFASIFGFSMILMSSWEYRTSILGLENGGRAGFVWIYFVSWMGFILINTSLAEMGSMAPTSGGQYHWVSEFAPARYQKITSYIVGWLCVLGWQMCSASAAYVAGTQIQGLLVLNYQEYVYESWHGTLLTVAVTTFGAGFNTFLARKLPMIEAIIVIIHIFAFFGILVTLWVLAPRASVKEVFTVFIHSGDWGSLGLSALVGLNGGISPLIGADSVVHMSEEIQDAARNIPRSMLLTIVVNGAMGWIMAITFAFCLGNMDEALASPTGYPYMQVFYNATQSLRGANAMAAFVVAITIAINLTTVASSSRQLWAFSRDKGVPFSSWFSYVHTGLQVPTNSILTTAMTTSLLSLINIGSATTLNAITSLTTAALLSSYIFSIGCMIWRRLTHQTLLPSKFSLGKWGLWLNISAEVFLVVALVFSFFPTVMDPSPAYMNWNILIYGVVVLGSLLYYLLQAKKRYVGPVEYVRKLE